MLYILKFKNIRMKKIVLFAAVIAVGLTSCNDKKTEVNVDTNNTVEKTDTLKKEVEDLHNSQNAVDWNGTYKGILPCADCEGIETIITLNSDETFTIKETYLKKNVTNEDNGTIMWHDGSIVHLKGKNTDLKFKVGENQIFALNQDGTQIEGTLKEHYILKKQ